MAHLAFHLSLGKKMNLSIVAIVLCLLIGFWGFVCAEPRHNGIVQVVLPDRVRGTLHLQLDPNATQPISLPNGTFRYDIQDVPIQKVNDIQSLWNANKLTASFSDGTPLVCAFGQPVSPDAVVFRLVGELHMNGNKFAVLLIGTQADYELYLRSRGKPGEKLGGILPP